VLCAVAGFLLDAGNENGLESEGPDALDWAKILELVPPTVLEKVVLARPFFVAVVSGSLVVLSSGIVACAVEKANSPVFAGVLSGATLADWSVCTVDPTPPKAIPPKEVFGAKELLGVNVDPLFAAAAVSLDLVIAMIFLVLPLPYGGGQLSRPDLKKGGLKK
jgi:hypothetical protein